MTLAFVFPGQGSQRVGMGRDLVTAYAEAREVFEAADDALGYSISRLCLQGPDDQLQLTAHTQPAIVTLSVAVLRAVEKRTDLKPALVAGHSVGEYSALVCAGVLRFEDAVRIVHKRGRFMQEAVPEGQGSMAAFSGLSPEEAEELCKEVAGDDILSLANFNSPMQTVIAGHRAAVERAIEAAGKRRRGRARRLPVSAPFHCALMEPARDKLAPELEAITFNEATVPVVSNVEAAPNSDGQRARELLIAQVCGSVQWVRTIQTMASQGIKEVVELGPGRVLSRLLRQIDRSLESRSIEAPEEIEPDSWEVAEGQKVYRPSGLTIWEDGQVWDPSAPGAFGV